MPAIFALSAYEVIHWQFSLRVPVEFNITTILKNYFAITILFYIFKTNYFSLLYSE